MTTLAILGGSSAFTPALAAALSGRASELPALDVRLFGRDARRTENVARVCTRVARERGVPFIFGATTELARALDGAAIVVNQVRVGGWAARAHDERFPLARGLPGDETLGPGGLSAAVRSAPIVRALAEEVRRRAPRAWFVQMSNPMGILLAALRDIHGLRTFGLCELPGETLRRALALVGRTRAEVELDYAGLNHQGWFHRIEHRGSDLLPALLAALAAEPPGGFFRVTPAALREWKALPLPYLALLADPAGAARQLAARAESRARELERLADALHARYAAHERGLPAELGARATPWFEQALVPALIALCGGAPAELYVSEPNRGYLPALADEVIVEKRARVGRDGPRAEPLVAPPPPALLAHIAAASRFEELAARAALAPGEDALLSALCAHPFGISSTLARALLADMLAPVEAAS